VNIIKTIFAISIPILVLALSHYYLWMRLVRDPDWPETTQRILTIGLIAAAFLVPIGLLIGWFLTPAYIRSVAWVGFTWMGLFFLLLVTTFASEFLRLFGADPDLSRRLLLSRGIAFGVTGLSLTTGAYAMTRALRPIGVKEIDITLDKLPRSLDGFVIAQITDVHIGSTIRREFLEQVVAKVNALNPGIIAITGDIVDGSVDHLRECTEPFSQLKARYGAFFVTGNHEYYSGADAWIAEFQRLGIRTLRNERVQIGEQGKAFDLVGIDDWSAHHFGHGADLPKALKGRDNAAVCVLLAHNPMAATEAIENGVDLQLSGHTHGGQIWPFNFVVRLFSKWVVGLYQERSTQIYVSPGTGYWGPPMRLGTEAEITKIVLRARP